MKAEAWNVLWVDDEIDHLKSLILFLESRGYKVTPATNGDDGVALVRENDYDLVLLDEMMPGKDGLTTLEEIKEIKPNLPVIMVTKSEEEMLMEQAIGKKIDDYLTKPVNPSQILSASKRLLEAKRIRESHLAREYVKDFATIAQKLLGPLSWKDWIDIHLELSRMDVEIEETRDVGLRQSHRGQKKECNLEFGRYVAREYPRWLKGEERPPLSVDIVKTFLLPLLREKQRVYFIVIDCMRLDQWLMVEPILAEYFNLKVDYYYSILPTATPYARNAIFSGLFPDECARLHPELWKPGPEEGSRNRYERQHLARQLRLLGLGYKEDPKYIKILDAAEGENLAKKISNYMREPLFSIVVNFLDILSHGRSESEILQEIAPDEAAFRSLMRSWFVHSSLFEVLQYLSEHDCTVVITTDHGSVLGTRGTIAHGRRDTSTNLRYKYGDNLNCNQKESVLIKDPKEYRLPSYRISTTYIIAREDFYFVYPTSYHEYERQYRNSFQHGGISLDEMILPVVTMKSKKF